jgi:hypothetical protein
MGIDCEIPKLMHSQWTPRVFSDFLPLQEAMTVDIDDIMTRVFMARGPNPDKTFTGSEFYDEVMRPARHALRGNRVHAYVIVADNKEGVPREKLEEQQKRSQSRNVEKYPSGSIFCDDGIRLRLGAGAVRFETQRLFSTRELRSQLWKYVLKRMRAEMWPDQKVLVFDFESAGPHVIDSNRYAHRTDLQHNLGEADLSWPYYMWLFHTHPIVIHTIDTDVIPIAMCYLHQCDPSLRPQSVHWRRTQRRASVMVETTNALGEKVKKRKYNPNAANASSQVQYLDLLLAFTELPRSLGLTPLQTVLFCVMSGSDFVQKKWLSHFANLSHIQEGCRAVKDLDSKIENGLEQEPLEASLQQYTMALLATRIRYSKKFMDTLAHEPSAALTDFESHDFIEPRLHMARGAQLPSPEVFATACKLVRFNILYWLQSWHSHTLLKRWRSVHEPVPSAARPEASVATVT